MSFPSIYQLLANLILATHVGVVVFVVGGLIYSIVGGIRHWRLARVLWFRLAHLAAIGVVVAQAWLGIVCPLTTLENWLRRMAHETTYSGGFIEHWLKSLLFYEAEPWVFTLVYTLFGLTVLVSWIFLPPKRKSQTQETRFLTSIPGMRESIKKGMGTPVDKCTKELKW